MMWPFRRRKVYVWRDASDRPQFYIAARSEVLGATLQGTVHGLEDANKLPRPIYEAMRSSLLGEVNRVLAEQGHLPAQMDDLTWEVGWAVDDADGHLALIPDPSVVTRR
jgi:hypothetical protein